MACNNGSHQVKLDEYVMSLSMHNQVHALVSSISFNEPKCGAYDLLLDNLEHGANIHGFQSRE